MGPPRQRGRDQRVAVAGRGAVGAAALDGDERCGRGSAEGQGAMGAASGLLAGVTTYLLNCSDAVRHCNIDCLENASFREGVNVS